MRCNPQHRPELGQRRKPGSDTACWQTLQPASQPAAQQHNFVTPEGGWLRALACTMAPKLEAQTGAAA